MIDLTNVKPNVVSTSLENYVGMIFGDPGCGKTTLAANIPRNLVIATEIGYKAIAGIHAQAALDYTSILTILNQIKKPQVKELYDVITIDTQDALFHIIQTHILNKYGVSQINDIDWGKGHTEMLSIWQKIIKTIIKEGYGLILIGHRTEKYDDEDTDKDNKYNTIALNNKKIKQYLMSEVDYAAYVESSRDPSKPSIMHFRPSKKWEAKARFAHIVSSIEFSYENLVKAINDAVEKESNETLDTKINYHDDEVESEDISQNDFQELAKRVEQKARGIINNNSEKASEVISTIEQYLGKKIAEATLGDAQRMKLLEEALEKI